MKTNTKTKKNTINFDGFGGVDLTKTHSDIFSARSIENFRVLNDGSLEKRQGYRFLSDLGGTVRAFWGGMLDGSYTLFMLIDDTLCFIIPETGERMPLFTVGTSSGSACFFFFRETLYLLDGEKIYEFTGLEFNETVGYVPLVAKDWVNDYIGEINEPRNILNRHARATYTVSDTPSIYLCAGEPIESVEAVYVNHALLSSSRYSINHTFNTINVQGLAAGDKVEVFFTYQNGYDDLMTKLCSATSSALFGGIGSNRIFLCGGSCYGTVFASKNVSRFDIALSQKHYPQSNGLYIPVGYEFEAGDGIAAVQAIARQYGHILIFTESDVWMITPDDDGSEFASATGVNGRIGCPVAGGATVSENEPVSIGAHSVFAWETDSQRKCDAQSISKPIDAELSEEYLKSCSLYYDATRNELWLYSSSQNYAWIYNTVRKAWYKFTGICADTIFDLNGSLCFIRDGKMFVFDDDCYVDTDENGESLPISASYVTSFSDLGTTDFKNLSSVTLRADLYSEPLLLRFDGEGTASVSWNLSDSSESEHSLIDKRVFTGRTKYFSLTLASNGNERQKIHSLTVYTR
ncbi:MAG: hypothetical protein IJ011_05500 [Clostridia bacterium]|nr:hypothetical protein [Clostridia bacterium]